MTKHDTYGDVVNETIDELVADLLKEARNKVVRLINPETQAVTENLYSSAEYPLEGEIETLLDLDDDLLARAAGKTTAEGIKTGPDFDALRRSKNGRLLLAHWKARAIWRERHADPQDAFDGHPPLPEDKRNLQLRLHMHDEEFAHCTRSDDASPDDYEAWEQQDRFVRKLTAEARAELIAELRARGVDPRNPVVVRWVEKRIAGKSWNQLRAYKSCTAILRRGYYTGFPYDGFKPARRT